MPLEMHRSSEPLAQTPQAEMLGGGWALRLRLQRSVPGSGLGLVVWNQPKGQGSSVLLVERSGTLRAGEWKAMAEGTQEKVWTHRRDKAPLLGRGEEKGWATTIENSCPHVHMLALPHHRGWSIPSTAPSMLYTYHPCHII